LGFHLPVRLALLQHLSKTTFEEEHKYSHYRKEGKKVGPVAVGFPVGHNQVNREYRHKDVGVFEKSVDLSPH
jgi:hypothetical protein